MFCSLTIPIGRSGICGSMYLDVCKAGGAEDELLAGGGTEGFCSYIFDGPEIEALGVVKGEMTMLYCVTKGDRGDDELFDRCQSAFMYDQSDAKEARMSEGR